MPTRKVAESLSTRAMVKRPLVTVQLSDIWRGTLDERSGNVGFLGVSPDGSAYHVVVPVDLQIARGVKACNQPTDGTPFGGYVGWRYFQCRGYSGAGRPEGDRALRERAVRGNVESLRAWAATHGIALEVEEDMG